MTAAADRPGSAPDLVMQAPAKVNLFLEVLGRRDDGFHELETVMQAIDLCDTIEFWNRPGRQFTISVSGGEAPADESNLALRAAKTLAEASGSPSGVHLHIEKRIPAGGGLGGGSSDAATTLRGLNRLWSLGISKPDLEQLGAGLGSDVNFFLTGGMAVCRGRGEIVEALPLNYPVRYILNIPQLHVSTKDIYASLGIRLTDPPNSCTSLIEAVAQGDLRVASDRLFNRLEEPVFEAHPELAAAKKRLAETGVWGALLSGSGATVYAVVDPGKIEGLGGKLRKQVRSGALIEAGPLKGWG